jgi:hypothetical protein
MRQAVKPDVTDVTERKVAQFSMVAVFAGAVRQRPQDLGVAFAMQNRSIPEAPRLPAMIVQKQVRALGAEIEQAREKIATRR